MVGYGLWQSVSDAYDDVLGAVERHDSPPELVDAANDVGETMAALIQTQWDDLDAAVTNLIKVCNEYNLPLDLHTKIGRLVETLKTNGLTR